MKRLTLFCLIFLVVYILPANGQEGNYIIVQEYNISNLGLFGEDIIAGSAISYMLTIYNNNSNALENYSINISIINPFKDSIYKKSFIVNIPAYSSESINSQIEIDGQWELIYADVPGIYKLLVSSRDIQLYQEDKTGAFKHDYKIPFYFEVRNPEENRILAKFDDLLEKSDTLNNNIGELITVNEEIAKDNKGVKISIATLIVSAIMLIISIITLLSTEEGRKTTKNIITSILMFIAICFISLLILVFLIELGII